MTTEISVMYGSEKVKFIDQGEWISRISQSILTHTILHSWHDYPESFSKLLQLVLMLDYLTCNKILRRS